MDDYDNIDHDQRTIPKRSKTLITSIYKIENEYYKRSS